MICQAKHTKYQPANEDWFCPKCGAGSDYFYIDSVANDADDECEKLHAKDYIVCSACGHDWTGQKLAAEMMRKNDLVICPHCNGKRGCEEMPDEFMMPNKARRADPGA